MFRLSVRIYEEYQELEEDSSKKQFYDDVDKILFLKNVQRSWRINSKVWLKSASLRSSKSSHSNHDKAVDVKVKVCYFMSMLQESVEKKIDCPRSQLTRLTKYNKLKSHELIKYFPNNRVECEYRNPFNTTPETMQQYTFCFIIIHEINRNISVKKVSYVMTFKRLFNFLMTC